MAARLPTATPPPDHLTSPPQVVKAYDHKCQTHVALKMVRNEKRFHRQAAEEIRILEHLRKQDKDCGMNVIHMLENFTFRNHICMTFELLSMNLYELIKKNKFQGFSLPLVRKFAYSILQCLDALHRNRIIHCDLKPENILLKQQGRSGIKVGRAGPPGSPLPAAAGASPASRLCAGDRLRLQLLRAPEGLHLHPVQVLPSAGGHSR